MHTPHKRISKYVRAEYKYGGDISSSIINGRKVEVMKPPTPVYADPDALTLQEETDRLIFKGLINSYIKRIATLDTNIQKAYHLIDGQCTLMEHMRNKYDWTE